MPVDLTGAVIAALSLLLGVAGVAKTHRPEPFAAALRALGVPAPLVAARAVAIAELVVAAVGLGTRGRIGGAAVAVAFATLTLGAAAGARRAGDASCGCFGDAAGAPLRRRHAVANLAAALTAGAAAAVSPPSLVHLAASRPAAALSSAALAAIGALALREWLRGAPGGWEESARRLVDASAFALESRFSRRSALTRVAVAGSALAVAPLRYLLYPGTALGVVVPGRCSDGLCTDGYTAFCCEINQGVNGCPAGTFVGGWWMCTDYRGHQLCQPGGVRYYVDCNALPGHQFPGGCRCADNSCEKRRVACNIFRYGQCNTQLEGTTAVVCRVVTCENPGRMPQYNCSTAVMVNDAVCAHEAGCLEPPPVQLPGVGGA